MTGAEMIVKILLLAALVAISAFFSMSETVFLILPWVSVRQMINEKAKHAGIIHRLKNNMSGLLNAVLLGNNIVNTTASALAAAFAITLAGNYGAGIATGVMSCVIIIFGEIIPKTIAARNPIALAAWTAPSLSFFITVMKPFVFFFNAYSSLLRKISKRAIASMPLVTEEELKTLIAVGRDEGTLETFEQKMLLNVFEFTNLRITSASRHRSLVKAIPVTASYDETLNAFIKTGYSRLPVYDGAHDNYVGLIHYKDVLFSNAPQMRPLRFVPGTMSCASLLQVFKKEKINFAVVVDEHGGNVGIITMEDILNAVLGKLYDEYDSEYTPAERIIIISATEFLVPGEIKLSDFNEIFSAAFESEYYDTLAGFLLEAFGFLPSTGEVIKRDGIIFEIEDQIRRRICTVRVRKC